MQIAIKIKGTNRLLLHKYTVATVSDVKIRKTDEENYSGEWIKGTYFGQDKKTVVMPGVNIMACLYDGARGMKKGKKATTRLLYTAIVVSPFEVPITFDGKGITAEVIKNNEWIDASGAVVHGSRIDRLRTSIPAGWEISFQIITKNETLSFDDIKEIVENAGLSAGLGDWRPSSPKKPGPNGTFEVVEFKKV